MKRILFVCLMCCVSICAATADDSAVDLDEILVTAYRYEEVLDKTPAQVTVISQEDIQHSNAGKVLDVLRSVPGITVRDLFSNGAQTVVDMGGFGEQGALNVLVLVDGRRVNGPDLSGVDWNQVPLDQVERIEIIQGGGTGVLYGDNASSGVINIITKKAKSKPEGTFSTEVGSYDLNRQKLSLGGKAFSKLSYWLNAGRESSNGYRHNSFYKAGDFAAKASYDLTDVLTARFASGFHESSYGMPGAVYQANIDQGGRKVARYGDDHANNKDYYFVTGIDSNFAEFGQLNTDFSYRRTETNSFFLTSGLDTRRNQILTYGITPKYTLTSKILDKNNTVITGLDLYRTFFNSDNYNRNNDHDLHNLTRIHKTSMAGYVQDELSVLDPLLLVGGYRYELGRYTFNYHDATGYNPDIDSKQMPDMNTYNAGLVYTYAPDSNVFVNTARTFRFPEVDEFTYQDINFQQQLNTALKPQSAVNYQVGVRHKFSGHLKGSGSLFRMDVRNELYFNPVGGPTGFGQNENYSRTVHEGLETSAESRVNDWMTLWGNYTYTNAYFDGGQYDNNEIPAVPRHKASLGLRFFLPRDFTVNVVNNYVGQRRLLNDLANNYGFLNGYMTVDTSISWTHNAWTVAFGVNNLLDKQYAEFAGVRLTDSFPVGYFTGNRFYYPSPERNFNLKVDYKF